MENDQFQMNQINQLPQGLKLNNNIAAAQLKEDKNNIKIIWENKVRKDIPFAQDQTSFALLNSIEVFLDELVAALEQNISKTADDIGKNGMSKMHGEQRAKFVGYYLPQLLKEFSILREVIFEDLHNSRTFTFEVGLIINSAIDSAISWAATEFTAVQQTTIKDALQKAETSNKDLENFATVAAHDLKSPLATITGYLDLLTEVSGKQLNDQSRQYINVMQRACERMRNLIDRLLEYVRLAKTDRRFHLVDLNDVMKSALQNLHEALQNVQARISFRQLPSVNGDTQLLTQVFQNLIANSLKFHGVRTPEIQIEFSSEGNTFLFSFKDNGIGFDPKDKEDIFSLYKKLRTEVEYPGTGIGLTTCKKVIELHGGRIWADSKPGIGSTFYFTLPNGAVTNNIIHH